ncbi:MAG: nucleotidyltransferase family protein [Vibrio sp.]|uniref:nucleotidyltransferase family protein n=1 Tax=Vibrio sp. TaxID=678 RepID=UPI003A86F04C
MIEPNQVTAIILCGGLGTRLRAVTNDQLPKSMLDVAGRPFLEYLLDYLIVQDINKVILAVSYRKEIIMDHFGQRYRELAVSYSIEDKPLGTGGAIKQALIENDATESSFFLILNGDTYFEYRLDSMLLEFYNKQAELIMALKRMDDTGRYGRVTVDNKNKIVTFEEKQLGHAGYINAGIYLVKKQIKETFPQLNTFSFEKDYLEKQVNKGLNAFASHVDTYFIDIGIPQDYYQANHYLNHH